MPMHCTSGVLNGCAGSTATALETKTFFLTVPTVAAMLLQGVCPCGGLGVAVGGGGIRISGKVTGDEKGVYFKLLVMGKE